MCDKALDDVGVVAVELEAVDDGVGILLVRFQHAQLGAGGIAAHQG